MLKMLGFFEAMVKLAYVRSHEGTDSQRSQIKGLLQEVLRAGVPVTTAEIKQCGATCSMRGAMTRINCSTAYASSGSESSSVQCRGNKLNVCLKGYQASVWKPQAKGHTLATRGETQADAGHADLARLWKFTHTTC